MQTFVTELRRRGVVKAVILYVVGGWLIMQIADVMFPALQLPRWSITLVAALLIIGLPIVVVFAWLFEVTPEGIKRTSEVTELETAARLRARRIDMLILATLAVAVGLLVVQLVAERREPAVPPAVSAPEPVRAATLSGANLKSIAVLPFVNMSDDPANEFFSDGISEELLNVLAQLQGLRVPSRTSSFAFKGQQKDIKEIGRQLNVDHVVEGSVRKVGNRVRVTAQLIELNTDSHLWSQTYDQQLEDIFAVQDEIARGIAQALQVKLGVADNEPIVAQKTDNIAAYELYLRGRQLWQLRRREAMLTAQTLLRDATRLDPQFAHAWATLAIVHLVSSTHSEADLEETTAMAEMAAREALRLDSSLAQPRAVLAGIAAGQRRYGEAEQLFRKAIELDSSDPTTHLWYAILLNGLGRLRDASLEYRLAVTLDPLGPIGLTWLAAFEIQMGNPRDALGMALKAVELGYDYAHVLAFEALSRLGDYEYAEAELRRGLVRDGIDPAFVQAVMEAQRDRSKRDVAVQAVAAQLSTPDQIQMLALLRADEALLEKFSNLAGTFAYLSLPVLWEKSSVEIRRAPQFKTLMADLGVLDYWRASGLWADHCRQSRQSFECDVAMADHP